MTSYLNETAAAPAPFAGAPVLIAGDSDAALARAELTGSAAGLRVGGKAILEAACERIAQQRQPRRSGSIWTKMAARHSTECSIRSTVTRRRDATAQSSPRRQL